MKWLMEFGAANLACAGLPCGWPDEADPDAGLELAETDPADDAEAETAAASEPLALH